VNFGFGKRKGITKPFKARADRGPVQERSPQWRAWREAAQRVTRTWHEWSAAERRHRPTRYESYLSAIADEERAALRLEHSLTAARADTGALDAVEPDQPLARRCLDSE
jgi:hypothetical protein